MKATDKKSMQQEKNGGSTKRSEVAPEEPKAKEPVTASELKSIIDKALRPDLQSVKQGGTVQAPNTQALTSGAGQKAAEDEGKVEKLVSEVRRDVNHLKFLKYDFAAVKGALQKINEPTRTCTPITSSSVHLNQYPGVMTGLPASIHISRSGPSHSLPSRSIPSRSRLSRPFPPHPKIGRTKTQRQTRTIRLKARRSINFGVEPITDTQLLHLHYTDLQDLCKMHNIKYKDKPQAIWQLRRVPGLIAYNGRDFNCDSDLETQINPDPNNIRIGSSSDRKTKEEELSLESSEEDDNSQDTSSSTEDLLGR
ncbi:hypothetical protein CBR_g45719 [Chara braunii]|uniref:Uncharacterized protein n=1 Tax=Chara braunii TaxID=69332 RepID=A0A388K3M2_CHABU|nr:hypothetical protein CBR_g45719 [Chara braunii]|eukprot:GBG64664.1 hypothetical protein CBR_g45719 [Chara braunii]